MDNLKISVIVPVYNVEQYVKRCIDSVLNQTMQEGVEVIIVNDCTPDRSMEIIFEALRAYNAHPDEKKMTVRVVNHDTNRGQAAVRNTAMSYATGDYTIQVDSDDWVEPDMLEKMYAKAVEEDADIVIADFYFERYYKQIKSIEKITDRKQYFKDIIRGEHASLWNKMIKRKLYTDNSIKWEEGFDRGEDYMTIIQLFYYAHKITYLPEAFYHYNLYNVNSICHIVSEKVKRNYIQMVEFADNFLTEHKLTGYEDDWAYMALRRRTILLANSNGKEREFYYHIFPKADFYLPTFLKQASIGERLLLHRHFFIYKRLKMYRDFFINIFNMCKKCFKQ